MVLPSPLLAGTEILLDKLLNELLVEPFPPDMEGKRVRLRLHLTADQPAGEDAREPDPGLLVGPLSLVLQLGREQVYLLPDDNCSTEATISGSPGALIALLLDRDPGNAPPAMVSGDLKLVSKLTESLTAEPFDTETLLAAFLPPQAAYHTGRLVTRTASWLSDAGQQLCGDLTNYLQYEKGTLVSLEEWQQLVDDTTALQRRIEALGRRIANLGSRSQ